MRLTTVWLTKRNTVPLSPSGATRNHPTIYTCAFPKDHDEGLIPWQSINSQYDAAKSAAMIQHQTYTSTHGPYSGDAVPNRGFGGGSAPACLVGNADLLRIGDFGSGSDRGMRVCSELGNADLNWIRPATLRLFFNQPRPAGAVCDVRGDQHRKWPRLNGFWYYSP